MEMEPPIGLSPEEHGGVKMFLKGELVEVRQREIGLRGSWHPAVVIDVKSGRRVVEYDELLTDDCREKLTESIPVAKCLDGGKLPAARQSWKPPAKRTRALLRPRPPPLPDPASIDWSKGLSVDCYFKDAWWEGVLTEAIPSITSASKLKRFWVWFPEEEDWEAMPLRDMRVGQQWDEDSGKWSLKGCVDVPVSSRRGNRAGSMSLGRESRGFTRSHRTDNMELAIALRIDETSRLGREAEYTSAWNNIDRTLDDADAVISVQLNSPTLTPVTSRPVKPANGAGTDRSVGEDLRGQRPTPLAVRSRGFESIPRQVLRSPRGRFREGTVGTNIFSGDEKDIAGGLSKSRAAAKEKVDRRALVDRERILRSGAVLDKETLVGEKPTLSMQRRSKDAEKGNIVEDALREGRRLRTAGLCDDDENRQLLVDSGWNVSQNLRKNGREQWYYRSPNGCLLGSLASAMGMWKQMTLDNKNCSGDDDNPTLSDMKTPKSDRGSTFSKGRPLNGRLLKGSRRVVSSNLVEYQEGKDIGELQPSPIGYVNGDIIYKLGPPAGSNGTLRPSNADGACVLPLSILNSKRNALEGKVDDVESNELKRRKVQGSSIEQSEPSSFRTSMSSGGPGHRGPLEGSVGLSAILALMDSSTVEEIGKPSNGRHPLETRSKKRTCQIEGIKHEHNNEMPNGRSMDSRSIRDGPMDHEPKSKKSRVISDEVSCPPEGKSRKSLAIIQESSRKKGSTPQKGADLKLAKKGATQVKKSASHVKKGKKSRTPARAGVRLEVLLSAPGNNRDPALGEGELTRKRTLLSWLIDNGKVVEHEKVQYLHRKDRHCMLEGYVTRDGILCDCCKKIVTLSVFEAHAGSKLHRPSANIFLADGRSLSICQVEALAVKTQNESNCQKGFGEQGTVDKSDDTCGICGDGGDLICCDSCPSTFHLGCVGLQVVPAGNWYCTNCRCGSCGGEFNVEDASNDLKAIRCDQCECDYHVKCLRARGLRLSDLPQDDFFCGESCAKIYQGLRSLVGVCKPMGGGFSWTLLRSRADDDRKAGRVSNTEINAEHDSKLSIALSVMQECFRPMIDPRTKIDIITHVLYNRRSDVSRLDYHGFYTMLLERADELISVATIRVHGARLAELPLIGTRFQYRRQGMCRRLMSAIEEMLQTLGVERLALPAVPELLDTWTGAFGFQPMDESERFQLMDLNIMAFPGTSILYKRLKRLEPVSKSTLITTVDQPSCAEIVQPGLPKQHSDASLASSLIIVKRGRGRPPKVKGEITNWNGLALAAPVAAVEAYKVAKSGHRARHSESPVACQPVTVKRGRGRPPKNKEALFNPSDGVTLAASMALVGAHELAEAGRDAGHTCSPMSQGVVEKAVGLLQPLNDQDQRQDSQHLPTVLRRKRGRPPRARVNYNSGVGLLSPTAISIPVQQVDIFQGQMQVSLTARDPNLVEIDLVPSQMLLEGRLSSSEVNRVDDFGTSPAIRNTTQSMQEVRAPLWLVESADDEAMPAAGTTLTQERSITTVALERQCPNEIPPLESSTTGSTKTYERRKSKLSPASQRDPDSRIQGDESESEPTYGPLDFFNQDGQYLTAEPGSTYEEVPIRAFPSQFASRGDHNTPPGTFIPVETIVVNSGPKVEPLDELLIPESEEKLIDSLLEREEQRSEGKLLLRLKFPKKNSPHATGDVELPQPSSPVIKLPNGALSPVGFTVPDQINEVRHCDQFEQGQPKQPDSSMGPHCISVTVS